MEFHSRIGRPGMDKLHDDLMQFAIDYDIPYQWSRRKKTIPLAFFDSIYQSFISSTIDELGPKFSSHQKLAAKISKLMPNHVKEVELADVTSTFEFYLDDLVSNEFLVRKSEFEMWRKRPDNNFSSTIDEVLRSTYRQRGFYTNIYRLLTIFATLPFSVATSERSFSELKLVKTYLRKSMGDQRLSALALLHVHKDLTLNSNPEDIVDEFAKQNRRIKLF